MAANSGSAPGTVLNFVDQVCGIIPDITPALLERLFDYLKSAGVYSEADIGKVDERQLAAIIGHDDARKLLDYFKQQELAKVKPPSSYAVNSSLPVATVAGPQTMAIGGSRGDGRDNTLEILQVVMSMQQQEGARNREMIMAMQQSQNQTLNVVTKAMSDMTAMHKGTLDKMSEQMTKQSQMHQDTIKVMNEQMKTTAKMHGETLQAVQQGMTATQRMNAETLAQVTKTMSSALEAQEKSMQEYRLSLAQRNNDGCAIM